jgi:hypothetical protein
MAQNISIGTADNEGDGQTLREAFRRVRKNFAEIYGDTDSANLTDTETLPTGTFVESVQDIVGGMLTGNTENNITVTYQDSDGTIDFDVSADITDVNAGSGLTGVNEGGGAATLNVGAGNGITVNADDVALASSVAGSGLTYTSGVLSVDAIDTAGISDDAVTAAKLNEFDDTLTASTSGDIIVSNGTDFIHATMSGDATIASGGALTIGNNKITHDKLENRYTALSALGSGSSFTVNFSNATTFTATANANATFTFSNAKQGQVIDLIVSGNYTITLSETGSTFNKVGGVDYDGSASNLIQVVCTDDTSGSKIYHYSVGTYTSDATPS